MDFEDSAGTRYQLTETAEAPAPAKKPVVWPWVVGGLVLAGGLLWMASSSTKRPNPVAPQIETLIEEARDPLLLRSRLVDLVKHPEVEVRRAVLDNPNVCPTKADGKLETALLEDLAKQFPEEVASHPLFVLHALVEPTQEMIMVVKEVVERTKDVGLIEHLLSVWGTSSWWVRQGVASNPNTPVNLLRTLGNPKTESDFDVRQCVARNPSTPEDVLRLLCNEATEEEWYVRSTVAGNPSTPVDILRSLGNEKTESHRIVREAVASNPNTPVDVLCLLGSPETESQGSVRAAVASNPSTPEDLLRSLGNPMTESDEIVRWDAAENPNTPVDVLRTLANPATESDKDVRKAARKALAKRGLA